MRIQQHPVIDYDRGERVIFLYNGVEVEGYTNETVAAALHAAGVRSLGTSSKLHRHRGLFCATGDCAGCLMTVDGEPNVRICITKCRSGMVVEEQMGKGVLSV